MNRHDPVAKVKHNLVERTCELMEVKCVVRRNINCMKTKLQSVSGGSTSFLHHWHGGTISLGKRVVQPPLLSSFLGFGAETSDQ